MRKLLEYFPVYKILFYEYHLLRMITKYLNLIYEIIC